MDRPASRENECIAQARGEQGATSVQYPSFGRKGGWRGRGMPWEGPTEAGCGRGGGHALGEAEGGRGEENSERSCQEQEEAQRTGWGEREGGSARRGGGGEGRGGGRGQGCRRVEGGVPHGKSGTDREVGLGWVSSLGKATPSSNALTGRHAGTLAGSSGGGHPAAKYFNRHQSVTFGTDRFGRSFAPLQTLGDVTNISTPAVEPARCLSSQKGMAPAVTRGGLMRAPTSP